MVRSSRSIVGAARRMARRPQSNGMRVPRSQQQQFSTASSSTSASASTGPPFKRYFLYTTAIMFGIPGAIGAVFVHNLKTDDEFYNHFNDRYPDLIQAIHQYYPLDESTKELSERTDIGPVTPTSELLEETMTVVAVLRSNKRVRFQVKGDANEEEIEKIALSHSSTPNDRVVSITFDEDADLESLGSSGVLVEENFGAAPRATRASPSQGGIVPQQRPGVGWKSAPKPAKKTPAQIEADIEAIGVRQAALEESKYAGRDVDEADDEIRALEAQKQELKKLLPRKRFLWIF